MSVQPPGSMAKDSGVPTKDFGLAEYLYSRLPEAHRIADQAQNLTVDVVKRQRPTIDDSQVPAENRDEPQLLRFMRILCAPFNFARTQTEVTLTLIDVEQCEAKWLNSVAKIIGWDLNNELPVDIQRKEILAAIDLYKRKGRETAIGFLIDQLTDFDYLLVELRDRILTYYTTRADIAINPDSHLYLSSEGATLDQPDDTNYHTLGTNSDTGIPYLATGVVLYLYQNLLNSNYLLLTSKIQRVIQEFAPFGVVIAMITIGIYQEPSYDAPDHIIESGAVQIEEMKPDSRFILTYYSPELSGTGILYSLTATNQYPLWHYFVSEGAWTHRIIP